MKTILFEKRYAEWGGLVYTLERIVGERRYSIKMGVVPRDMDDRTAISRRLIKVRQQLRLLMNR